MITEHSLYIGASQHMTFTEDNSIDLVVTSPPNLKKDRKKHLN